MNKVLLIGQLTKDPEPYHVGRKLFCTLRLKVMRSPSIKGSIFDPDSDDIPIVFWDKNAELVKNHCTKGSLLRITGHIQIYHYYRKNKRYWIPEVVAEHVVLMRSTNTKNIE